MSVYQDPNAIVTVQVTTILAPAPQNYQQSGVLVSFGGTTIVPNSVSLLTQFSDLSPLLQPSGGITGITWATGIATVTTSSPLPTNVTTGSVVQMVITGILPPGYNGAFTCTVTGPSEFTYPLTTDPGGPGGSAGGGQFQLYSVSQLNSMASTFFRQGTGTTCFVLELGYQPLFSAEISAMEDWLNLNPLSYYGYLMPDYWGTAANIPAALALYQQFTDPEAMTYFWTTIELAAVGLIPNTVKCVIQMIEAPGVQAARNATLPGNYSEFTLASMFFWAMQYKATSVTRISPMCFKYVYGVTAYPSQGNGPRLVSFKNNFVNYIQTGAEGGIAFTNVYQGVTADGKDYFNWWWTIDWVQLSINVDLTNAIINGSNNPLAPLYYDQPGINYLESVLAGTMTRGGQFGLVNGAVVQTELNSADLSTAINSGTFTGQCNVNAVPFIPYSQANPSHYGIGEYDGLSTIFIPARGFVHILVVVVATDIVTL
jgi:hypothetical protein